MAQHSDDVSKVAPATEVSTAQTPATAPKSTSNDAQAAKAEAERHLEYTVGGDDPEGTSAAAAAKTVAAVEALTMRVRSPNRPSPFGTAFFPPIPAPPKRR